MSEERLPPMVDWIGPWKVEHGERDLLDPDHPDACLCGHPYYLWCDERGIESWAFTTDRDGHLVADGGLLTEGGA